VHSNGSKYWRMRYPYAGKEKILSLGVFPDVSLAQARDVRDAARRKIRAGTDPMAERQAKKQQERLSTTNTFESVAREWLEKQAPRWSTSTLEDAQARLEKWVFPKIGKTAIDKLKPAEVLRVLRAIEAQSKHETAHRVRQRIGQVCRYAVMTGRADTDPSIALKGALTPVPTRHRSAITEPGKAGELLRAIEGYSGEPATCAALKLIALTFVRPGELRWAEWQEFDLKEAVWKIPAERMKMKRDHIVSLSRQAVAVLQNLFPITGRNSFVFPSNRPSRPLSENTLNYALRGLGYGKETMSAHGFRTLASTLLHEQGFPPEVIELQLAHAQRNQVAAAYNRSARLEERRRMMQHWADYLDRLKVEDRT